jgi:hypothetical protein
MTRGPAAVQTTDPGSEQNAPAGGIASGGTGASIGALTSLDPVASADPASGEEWLLSLEQAVRTAKSKGHVVAACFK